MSQAVSDADRVRHELYDVMAREAPFEEKAEDALELGEAFLGVENGHLTRVDTDADYWEAIASTDPPEGEYPAGLVLDLERTYCRRTVDRDAPVALHDAPAQGWADDPAFEAHGLHCYHGTTLTVDGETYGTVCFVAEEPREEPFDDGETMFAELVARTLEHELERARQEKRLGRQADTIAVLSRVLRHNLRNDMAVVRGRVKMLAERLDDAGAAESVVERVDDLIRLSDTAREFESVLEGSIEDRPVDVTDLVERAVEAVAADYPSASFAVAGGDGAIVPAMPSLETALEELIENAAKHGAESPHIAVSVEADDGDVRVHVSDDGAGLPEQERAVLSEGAETPLVHGSGLGLWLTYWVVTEHDGTIETSVGDGTRVTVSLPRANAPPDGDLAAVERRVQRERDRFRAVFDEAGDAMVVTDDDGRFLEANERAAVLFGVDCEDLLGRSVAEFTPPTFDVEAAWRAFQSGETRQRGTFPLVRPDGTGCLVEYSATTDIVPGEHLSILRKVTDRGSG